jgi:hypothetical protein
MSNINISDLNSANELRDISDRELELQGGFQLSFFSLPVDLWLIIRLGIGPDA